MSWVIFVVYILSKGAWVREEHHNVWRIAEHVSPEKEQGRMG